MTRKQTVEVIGLLQTNYPDVYRNMSDDALAATVNLWARMFADEPYEIVAAAVLGYIANSPARFAPNIGQVKEAIRKLLHPEELSEAEAWALVLKAVKNSGYGARAEFDKLPPLVQRAVGSPNQLREWGMMDSGEFQSVVASNFQRSYRAMQARAAEQEKTPERIRAYFAGLTKPMPEAIEAPAAPALEAGEAITITDAKRTAALDMIRERLKDEPADSPGPVITPEAKAAAIAKLREQLAGGGVLPVACL